MSGRKKLFRTLLLLSVDSFASVLSRELFRVQCFNFKGPNWKEAARILKCIVQLNNIALNGQTQVRGDR